MPVVLPVTGDEFKRMASFLVMQHSAFFVGIQPFDPK
jgi:hypothetical protein